PEYKRSCHDACLRIPLVVRGAEFIGGQTITELATNLDLPATILRVAGLEVPEHYHSQALQDVLTGAVAREAIYVQISESQCGRAIRTPRWTYSVRAPGGHTRGFEPFSDSYHERHLYDNQADPHQRNNLIREADFAEVRKALKQQLLDCMVVAGEEPADIMAPE
ncbi:MAG: sulfatase/phosphatase domain-containing protein, partial [Pseudomonadota bacterium]